MLTLTLVVLDSEVLKEKWFIYVLLNDIEFLDAYGLGSANNGGGTDGEELILSGSPLAGDDIAVVRSPDAIDAYLASDAETVFDHFY